MAEAPEDCVKSATRVGLVLNEVFGTPCKVSKNLWNSTKTKREVAIIFVEKIDFGGSNSESKPAHVPVRLFGLEKDAVESDRLASGVPEDALAVEVDILKRMPRDPVARGLGLKF